MRAYSWNRALKHWIRVHNDLPRSAHQCSPNAIIDNMHQVDARYQYRFAYGDIVLCYPLAEKERRWKFDTKNEMGFYLGDKKDMKDGYHVYQPHYHKILTRGDVHRVRIYEIELLEWYGKRDNRDCHGEWSRKPSSIYSRTSRTSRGQRRHLGRQRPGRHGIGATIAYARST